MIAFRAVMRWWFESAPVSKSLSIKSMYLSDPKPPRRISEVFNDVPVLPSPGSKMKPSSEYLKRLTLVPF